MTDVVDSIVKSIDYGATVVTEKAKAGFDEAKLRVTMEGLKGEREEALIAIGELVIGMYKDGIQIGGIPEDDILRVIGHDRQIAFLRGKIDGVRYNADENIRRKKEEL